MLPSTLWSFLFFLVFSSLANAQGPVQTLFPAGFPLAVKTPYVSVWYQSLNSSTSLPNSWPYFWGLQSIMGWSGKIRVNGTTYKWMGQDTTGTAATVTNIQVTPTRTIFVLQAGPMNVTVTFLSPVEPSDWVKQSIPFSYVSVEAESIDGKSYPVQLYSDISAEWASGNRSSLVKWNNVNTGKSIYHQIELQDPQQNSEYSHQAQDGKVYYAISTSQSRITWEIDVDSNTRDGFQSNGALTNVESTAFSSISPVFPVFALAVDLGTIKATSAPVTWSVGYVRDPLITYTTATGATQQRRPYYAKQYSNIGDVIDAFTGDYSGALSRAVALDQKITSDAAKISSQYSDIVALSVRQTMSALDFTVGTDSKGNVEVNDVKIFMKNLGTDRRINPVEHIYIALPTYLYLNASICGSLLQPLLETQATLTGQQFAAQDLGDDTYPVATGPNAVAQAGIEQSGNMLISALAHARISGDGSLLSEYYATLKRWADYLVSNSARPGNQLSFDAETTANLTNLAIKGVIGVKAMAEISRAVGQGTDATQYDNQASALFSTWLSLATSSGGSRLLGSYGDQQSWSTMYNLFADKLLGLDFVTQSVIDMQTQYLSSLLTTAPQWGLPIDSNTSQFGNAGWSLFTAAVVSDNTVRDNIIKGVYNHANYNQSAGIFPERYNVANNAARNGFAGPGVGGVFSHLALTLSNQTISVSANGASGSSSGGSGSSSNIGAIVGGVIGGLAIIGIAAAIVFILLRKRRRQQEEDDEQYDEQEKPNLFVQTTPHHPSLAPHYPRTGTATAPSVNEPFRAGNGSDYAPPLSPHSDTTAGFAGLGTNSAGALQVVNPAGGYAASTHTTSDAYENTAMVAGAGTGASSKAREAALNRTHHYAPSVATSSNVGSQTGSASSRDLLSPGSSASHSISPTDVLGLRAEVENLRRVMQEIRAERFEPPPEYVEE
ncbi:hypothetical protein GSI_01540 [Ganoderma sinense ZZ0214-1]|uniref:DUF1793-domain-containing protein n=1 Tax=Ganoderma sinense ZZ0214-1 TaxID=1077348 RepID=A0A2G8SQ53_9APHY|nr:hypothetical protein GSI_01540 [Ganoderma sinense ZZ0214-1]